MFFSGNRLTLEGCRQILLCSMITLFSTKMEDPSRNLHILIDFFFSQKEQQQVHLGSTVFQLLFNCIYQIVVIMPISKIKHLKPGQFGSLLKVKRLINGPFWDSNP